MEPINLLLFLICLILIGIITYLFKKNNRCHFQHQEKLHQIITEHQETIKQMKIAFEEEKQRVKKVALTGSRNIIKGTMSEKFCPFQPNFIYSPADCSFLGKPIDFIIFNNIEKYRDNAENVSLDDIEIVFLEIKTGKSSLTKVEKAIQYAIENKRIRFETYRYQDSQDSQDSQPTQNTPTSITTFLAEPPLTPQNAQTQNKDLDIKKPLTPLDFSKNDLGWCYKKYAA